eukprot:1593710-Pleurochrysis_carterae.AAC.1
MCNSEKRRVGPGHSAALQHDLPQACTRKTPLCDAMRLLGSSIRAPVTPRGRRCEQRAQSVPGSPWQCVWPRLRPSDAVLERP